LSKPFPPPWLTRLKRRVFRKLLCAQALKLCNCNKNNCRKQESSSIPTSDTTAAVTVDAPSTDEDTAAVTAAPPGMIAGALATTPEAINRDLSLLTRLPIPSPKLPPSVSSPILHRNTYTDSGATTNNTTTTQQQQRQQQQLPPRNSYFHEEKPPPHSLRNSLAIAQKPLDGFRLRNAKEITRAAIAWHGKWTEKTRQNHDARKNQQGWQARRLQREATQNRTEQSRTHFLLTLFVCLVACGAMHRFFYVRDFAKMREIKRGIFCGNFANFFLEKNRAVSPEKKKKKLFFSSHSGL
jgi:hypothetical protein